MEYKSSGTQVAVGKAISATVSSAIPSESEQDGFCKNIINITLNHVMSFHQLNNSWVSKQLQSFNFQGNIFIAILVLRLALYSGSVSTVHIVQHDNRLLPEYHAEAAPFKDNPPRMQKRSSSGKGGVGKSSVAGIPLQLAHLVLWVRWGIFDRKSCVVYGFEEEGLNRAADVRVSAIRPDVGGCRGSSIQVGRGLGYRLHFEARTVERGGHGEVDFSGVGFSAPAVLAVFRLPLMYDNPLPL
ncbi:hypothetical protein J3A83DRAFT_4192328 [Scleroderma citrinum]